MALEDHSRALIERVERARAEHTPLAIHGGNSKAFYGRPVRATPLDASTHRGIVHYEPTELVMTARGGTPLTEIEAALAEHGQMLACEPPHFGANATLGGCVAAGLSGPRRPYAGAVRDHVLGVEIVNGKAERLRFGGEVIKNVAGYDLSRLLTGSLGTLGIVLEVSIKVLPESVRELTLAHPAEASEAIRLMAEWARRPLPITATFHDGACLYVRLGGGTRAVDTAAEVLGGDALSDGPALWRSVREHDHTFFGGASALWRLSMPPATAALSLPGKVAMEWSGALRWLKTDAPAADIREAASSAGGHATLFRGGNGADDVFQPLTRSLMTAHQSIKRALDPLGLFNPGRIYPDL